MEYVTYDEFKKMDIRVGTIREIESVEGADKLLKCMVEIGDVDTDGNPVLRQIVSGIHEYFPEYQQLIGKQVLYIVNLEPRTIRGVESNGMLMAVGDGAPIFLIPENPVTPGSKVR
jgi:methionyl-tRNA synthetase